MTDHSGGWIAGIFPSGFLDKNRDLSAFFYLAFLLQPSRLLLIVYRSLSQIYPNTFQNEGKGPNKPSMQDLTLKLS